MAIDTREKLHEYILRKLGAPYVSVEVHSDSLDDIIDETIQEFSEFAFSADVEETYILNADGANTYQMPTGTTAILKLSRGSGLSPYLGVGAGLVLSYDSLKMLGVNMSDMMSRIITTSAQISMLNQYFGDELAHSFSSASGKLTLFQPYTGPVLVHLTKNYVPGATDQVYDHIWIKKMCTAKARLQQATVVGKYDQALVGGARINYNDMRAQAQEEMQELKEDLLNKWSGVAPVFIG